MGEYSDFPTPVTLTGVQVAAAAALAGFGGSALVTAVAVSYAENGSHDTLSQNHNRNGTVDTGLWQINSVHAEYSAAQLIDPQENAKAAYAISGGGHDWSPWTTYQNGAYRAHLGQAQADVQKMQSSGGPAHNAWHDQGGQTLFGHPFQSQIDSASGAVSGAVGSAESVAHFLGNLSDVRVWERVAYVVSGLLAMGIGLFAILKSLGVAVPIPIPV